MQIIKLSILVFYFLAPSVCLSDGVLELNLNETELNFLSNKKEILKCVDPKWMPFESIDDQEQHIGIIADIMDLISIKIGVPINLVVTHDWSESHDFLKKNHCDIITSDAITKTVSEYSISTIPFLLYKDVFITQKSTELALNFEAISNNKIGFVKNYPTITLTRENFPKTNVIEVNSIAEGVLAVSKGEIYAFVDLLPSISYSIQQQGLTNLKVAGHVDINIPIVMSIRRDQPELLSIINKAILSISNKKKNEIFNQWVSVDYERTVDYLLFLEFLACIMLVSIVGFYWISRNKLLQQEVIIAKERERIMSDMHDGVGGKLVSALALLDSKPPPYKHIKQCLAECLADIRVVILSLDLACNHLTTLLGMFRHSMSKTIESSEIELSWFVGNIDNAPPLNSKDALNILRIMQEAITNVIKHSGANRLKIITDSTLINSKQYIQIDIMDNGINQSVSENNGYGIKNMKKRANELGGFISIEPTKEGTTVSLKFPL